MARESTTSEGEEQIKEREQRAESPSAIQSHQIATTDY
jgi:hypothetical protein